MQTCFRATLKDDKAFFPRYIVFNIKTERTLFLNGLVFQTTLRNNVTYPNVSFLPLRIAFVPEAGGFSLSG